MKLNGRVATVNVVTEMFIREGQEPLIFKASAVVEGDEFNKLVPEPVPPSILRPGDATSTPDRSDPKFQKALRDYSTKQTHWMILKSLEATPGLIWDTIKIEDPTTWANIDEELKEFGLSNIEKGQLIRAVMRANSLDERFIEAAKARFIASQQSLATPTSFPQAVPQNMKSGELVKP